MIPTPKTQENRCNGLSVVIITMNNHSEVLQFRLGETNQIIRKYISARLMDIVKKGPSQD